MSHNHRLGSVLDDLDTRLFAKLLMNTGTLNIVSIVISVGIVNTVSIVSIYSIVSTVNIVSTVSIVSNVSIVIEELRA